MYGDALKSLTPSGIPPPPGPGPMGASGPPPGPPPPGLMMPPPPAAIPSMAAEEVHRKKQDHFLNQAIADFHKGGITRAQLAEAVGAHDAYDYKAWKESNVIHPSHASPAHNEMPPEESMMNTPPPTHPPAPIQGAGSL
jgi:hypothetical protein